MVETMIQGMLGKGYAARIIPAGYLKDAGTEIENLYIQGLLDKDFYEVLRQCHDYSLADAPFKVGSIILVASPCPGIRVYFSRKMKKVPLIIPPTYRDYPVEPGRILEYLGEILSQYGYHARRAFRLPEKLLAVRSGLGSYGRNNLCYVKGMGSFALISAYYSDLPYSGDHWNEITLAESCRNCGACISNCPTGALSAERFLVKAERCITYYNEFIEAADFPQWMDPSAHNCIIGCLRCQTCCPGNKDSLKNVAAPEQFDEYETDLLIKGRALEELPASLLIKLEQLGLKGYFEHLSRNLKVLLDG